MMQGCSCAVPAAPTSPRAPRRCRQDQQGVSGQLAEISSNTPPFFVATRTGTLMVGSGGGINQRLVRGLEPSPGVATLIYLAVVALLLWALSRGVVPGPIRGFAPVVIGLIVIAIVVYGLRWITFRRVLSMSRDPQLAADLPDLAVQPRGPFAPPQPTPVVVFRTPRRMFARVAR
jgi:hypothetical protein